jgi:hypothetical protein
MARKAFLVVGFALLLQFLGVMLLGPSTGGVELGQIPVPQPGADYQPSQLPPCVSAHTYARRAWPGLQMIGSDVWLVGCNDADGRLRISSRTDLSGDQLLGARYRHVHGVTVGKQSESDSTHQLPIRARSACSPARIDDLHAAPRWRVFRSLGFRLHGFEPRIGLHPLSHLGESTAAAPPEKSAGKR